MKLDIYFECSKGTLATATYMVSGMIKLLHFQIYTKLRFMKITLG